MAFVEFVFRYFMRNYEKFRDETVLSPFLERGLSLNRISSKPGWRFWRDNVTNKHTYKLSRLLRLVLCRQLTCCGVNVDLVLRLV